MPRRTPIHGPLRAPPRLLRMAIPASIGMMPPDAEIKDANHLLIEAFQTWKSGGEYGHYLFGKYAAYAAASVDGTPYLLRHVHLAPLSDQEQLKRWNGAWLRRSRKTSDKVLVYVERKVGNAASYLPI